MRKLILSITIFLSGVSMLNGQELYSGVWQQGTEGYALIEPVEWGKFNTEYTRLTNGGFRLTDIETYRYNNKRYYVTVWKAGNYGHAVLPAMEWGKFNTEFTRVSNEGYRLMDLETYSEGGKRYYLSVWKKSSEQHAVIPAKEWGAFQSEWTRVSNEGLRLKDIETYSEGGKRYYIGVYRSGSGKHALLPPQEWSKFEDEWTRVNKENYRLSDLEIYEEGGKRYYLSVWNAGSGPHALWSGKDWESFNGRWAEYGQANLRLTDIETRESDCDVNCLNHVMQQYDYWVKGSSLHCEGLPGNCPSTSNPGVTYHWPSVNISGKTFLRHSALDIKDQIFTLPFKKPAVEMTGFFPWMYKANDWHEAIDYYTGDDYKTFEIVASAPGKVIHMGWDDWSGNTVIVSHNAGGKTDVYRTIYMHLRNGAANDCSLSWTNGVPASGKRKSDYKSHLNNTGCPEKVADRDPKSANWGTDSHKLDMSLLGKTVSAGDVIGWAGSTGPGGMNGNHLHIFYVHRDPTDNRWYFFDPYGIYATKECYPSKMDGSINKNCARYPIAWKNGKPGYAQ